MLREMRTRQIEGEPRRVWFTDDYFDLYVWFDVDGGLCGFRLCYDKQGVERAVTWLSETFQHHRVDSGENGPWGKMSPVLAGVCPFEAAPVRREFELRAEGLPREIRALVLS